MSSTKTSGEGQMGSGESDDEFYNVKMPNAASTVNKAKDRRNEPTDKAHSPPRTKVKYDYKFDSSSDDDGDEMSSGKGRKSDLKPTSPSDRSSEEKKEEEGSNENSKLPQNTSKVVEKINEELKSMKNFAGCSKVKGDKSDVTPATAAKHIPSTTVGVTPPVVVVPPPIIVPQSHSVMAMGPAGMIVPPAIGLANQSVMIPQANMLNLPGNVIRGANAVTGLMGAPMGIANPSLINQGNLVGMTSDILQGNIMGMAAPGNLMQIPAGLCMTGNMIPVQSNLAALQGNLLGMQGTAGNIMANQTILNNQGSIITNPGGVMMNPANVITVNALMNNQGTLMANPGNIMLNMNSLVGNQSARMNYPGSILSGINSVRNPANVPSEIGKNQVNYPESRGKSSDLDWRGSQSKSQSNSDRSKYTSSKSPSPSDSEDGNDEDDEEDGTSRETAVRETTNTFKNDGSFMEMFKKMSEANNKGSSNKDESSSAENAESEATNAKKPPVMISGIVGKRRGGRVLKTGLVKKVKKESEAEEEKGPKDAWAMYMAEVKKYREASCEEEGKTRPLVK